MQNNSKLKYFFIVLATVLIALISYFTYKKHAPYKVYTPENYPAGTVVSLYNSVPPNFPKEVILENMPLKNSSLVKTAQGKTQISLSYVSGKEMNELFTIYRDKLIKNDWQVVDKTASPSSHLFVAENGGKTVIITISKDKDKTSLVYFQYQY
jgi:hypothetical protein